MPVQTPSGIQGQPLGPKPLPAGKPPLPRPRPGAAPQDLPQGPQHPALAKVGFFGTVEQFGDRVARTVQAHRQSVGFDPSPGLVLDVARSPIPSDQISQLFYGHQDPRAIGALNKERQQNPDGFLKVRNDGLQVMQGPFQRLHEAGVQPHEHKTLSELQKKYPNVQMGMLPIPGADKLIRALDYLNKNGGMVAGGDMQQFQQEVQRAQPFATTAQQKAAEQLQHDTLGLSPAEALAHQQNILRQVAPAQVKTVGQAKKDLALVSGVPFSSGPTFNQDDIKLLSNWMKSADYFRKVTKYQAQQAGYSDPTKYLHDWKSKQYSVQHNGLASHFLNNMPLQLFGHGLGGGVLQVPKYIFGGSGLKPWNVGLHALTKSAGLGLDTVGGTIDQAKSDLAAGHAFVQSMTLDSKSFDQALKRASEQLKKNPTWLQVLWPGARENEFTSILNLVGDFVLLRKASFTGERVAAGDLATARNASYLNAASQWAFRELATGNKAKIGRAAALLEGGPGANRLATAAFPLVKAGKMTQEQFTEHLAQLYAHGTTTLKVGDKEFEITGRPLSSMQSARVPAPGNLGRGWIGTKGKLRAWLDAFDASPRVGNSTKSLVNSLRSSVAHAAPKGALNYFDNRLPEAVYNFVAKNKLGDRAFAEKMSSDIVRFQAKENVVGLQKVERQLNNIYREQFPIARKPGVPIGEEPEAKLEPEAPSLFKFPGGGLRDNQGVLAGMSRFASRLDDSLNRLAKWRTRLVLSTGFSLGWKHLFGDGWRAVVGGVMEHDKGMSDAAKEIEAMAKADPAVERKLGVFLQRAALGETRYALGREGAQSVPAFRTGERFGRKAYMTAAGGELRRLLTAPEIDAWRNNDLENYILHDKTARRLFHSAQGRFNISLEDYTKEISSKFQQVEDAANGAAVSDVWDRAMAVLRENRGAKADAALGDFIDKNKLDFNVHSPRVETANGFDEVTGRVIGFLMSPNKMWRKKLAENVLHNSFAEMRRAGFEQNTALEAAMDAADRIVKYHMLDFSNRLQLEQDLRWLSWFATKHRLYWKWVIGTMVRHPGWAAVVNDARQHLDPQGYLNFEVFGHKLSIPAARLFWVPGREYDETSPDAQFIAKLATTGSLDQAWNSVKTSSSGNFLTRVDTPFRMMIKAATASTYGQAVAGLPAKDRSILYREFNEYQLRYFQDHGHYAPESDVVKHVLWSQSAQEMWRSTLPLPVVPDTNRTEQQNLLHQYMLIVDPAKKRDFLNKHPDVAKQFGVYDDPHLFLHKNEMFAKYTALIDHYHAARRDIYNRAKAQGFTGELRREKSQVDQAFQKSFGNLLRQDARWAGHKLQDNQTPGELGVPYGPWGQLVSADQQLDARHMLSTLGFTGLKQQEFGKVYGVLQKQLQAELTMLNDPQYAATYGSDSEIKTRKVEILQQLDAYRKQPGDALGKTWLDYQEKYVNPYWKHYEAEYTRIGNLPADQKTQAYADFTAWRDAQDHPVTVDGIKFESPVRMAYANMDPVTKQQRIRYFASKNWSDLTNFEKEMLTGKKPNADLSDSWDQFKKLYSQASRAAELQGSRLPKGFKMSLAKYVNQYRPGFLNDYMFSEKPLYQRLQLTQPIQHSQFKEEWNQLFQSAAGLYSAIKSGVSQTRAHAAWRAYIESPAFQTWLDTVPAFKREVNDYGPNVLTDLVN